PKPGAFGPPLPLAPDPGGGPPLPPPPAPFGPHRLRRGRDGGLISALLQPPLRHGPGGDRDPLRAAFGGHGPGDPRDPSLEPAPGQGPDSGGDRAGLHPLPPAPGLLPPPAPGHRRLLLAPGPDAHRS